VPPGVAHNGIAVGDDCMTYSIGFRAPSRGDLIGHWAEHIMDQASEDERFTDPGLALQDNPGEITPEALARLHDLISEKLSDRHAFARWFGGYNTAPKNAGVDWSLEDPIDGVALRTLMAEHVALIRNPACRFAFVREEAGGLMLFVDGQSYSCHGESAGFAERLCASDLIEIDAGDMTSDETIALMVELLNLGVIAIDEEE
jgi:50S ribosomal protein L16 3-hydroxylase